MDTFKMTAPCGLDCFNCDFHLAKADEAAQNRVRQLSAQLDIPFETMLCDGCRAHDGKIPLQLHIFGANHRCAAYECIKAKGLPFCCDCDEFPCDHLHPLADKADVLPHNTKVYNLCLIKRMGLKAWAEKKAAGVRRDYFSRPWSLAE